MIIPPENVSRIVRSNPAKSSTNHHISPILFPEVHAPKLSYIKCHEIPWKSDSIPILPAFLLGRIPCHHFSTTETAASEEFASPRIMGHRIWGFMGKISGEMIGSKWEYIEDMINMRGIPIEIYIPIIPIIHRHHQICVFHMDIDHW